LPTSDALNLPVVIVLAAGRGERFRASALEANTQDKGFDKLQAPLAGMRVRDHVVRAVQLSGLPMHVVEPEHLAHLDLAGMSDSIACGVRATANASGWLILPADLPLIEPETLRLVAQALHHHDVVVPFFENTRGHPVGFSAACGPELMQLSGDKGASAVVSRYRPHQLHLKDAGSVMDVDTVDLLLQAEKLLLVKSSEFPSN
jgi:molybdenum cofactor cytidylyltransferase